MNGLPRSGTSVLTGDPALLRQPHGIDQSRGPVPRAAADRASRLPDTTANEKIVFAKSYSANEAGTIARPDGV